jgi:hypothetical protein
MGIEEFYLKDHDFQVYINKGCQTYGRTPDQMFKDPIVQEYYKSLIRGGCNHNEKQNRPHDN